MSFCHSVTAFWKLTGMGLPVNFADSDGRTPLIWAADRGELSAVEILLAKGAEINAQVGP